MATTFGYAPFPDITNHNFWIISGFGALQYPVAILCRCSRWSSTLFWFCPPWTLSGRAESLSPNLWSPVQCYSGYLGGIQLQNAKRLCPKTGGCPDLRPFSMENLTTLEMLGCSIKTNPYIPDSHSDFCILFLFLCSKKIQRSMVALPCLMISLCFFHVRLPFSELHPGEQSKVRSHVDPRSLRRHRRLGWCEGDRAGAGGAILLGPYRG